MIASSTRSLFASLVACALLVACDQPPSTTPPDDDAGPPDAGPRDGGTLPARTDHCDYQPMQPTARAGGTVAAGALSAGAAERPVSIPVGATLGAYTSRSSGFGSEGFVDQRRPLIAGSFAGSVGIETWPRVRAVALTTGPYDASSPAGEETIIIMQADLGVAYQGHLHALEERLGPEFRGKILWGVSHSHSSFANFTGNSALQVGFGAFRETAFDALLGDLEATARAALAAREPARIGFAHDGAFDAADRVTRDRRGENDDLSGGMRRDDHDLYVIRVDAADGRPLAVLPVFGMHGTSLGGDNVMASGDAPGGVARVLEEQFDEHVVVLHMQGAGGDVSPVGIEGATRCGDRPFCQDFARLESVGWNAHEELLAAWTAAGADMRDSIEMEMVTRSIERGPNWETFRIRGGALEYAPFDWDRLPDFEVWEDPETMLTLRSPIDEFNAPIGAALCGGGLATPFGRMPGASDPRIRSLPYGSCNMLVERVVHLFETALDLEFFEGVGPLCDTTRATVSAARIGDHMIVTLPGEPLNLVVDRLREQLPFDTAHEIVIGYAQDHVGYILTPEDWLRGGYEPTITFWGPLEGELIAEGVAQLATLVTTAEREDGAMGGTTRVGVHDVTDTFGPDAPPTSVPLGPIAASPEYLLTQALPEVPPPQPAATVPRLESTYFTWVGLDPLMGTPVVTLERDGKGFSTVERRSGRPVSDGEILVTWTPNPLLPLSAGERIHYWTAQWQAVGYLDVRSGDTTARLADRVGVPLGRYRFRVVGPRDASGTPLYEFTSDAFDVVPGALSVMGTTSGTTVTLDLGYHAPNGYRLLDTQGGATQRFPVRGGSVDVSIDGAPAIAVTVSDTGSAMVTVPAGFTELRITDRFGNTGTYRR